MRTTINSKPLVIDAFTNDGTAYIHFDGKTIGYIQRERGYSFSSSQPLTKGYTVVFKKGTGLKGFSNERQVPRYRRRGERYLNANGLYGIIKSRVRRLIVEQHGTDNEKRIYCK